MATLVQSNTTRTSTYTATTITTTFNSATTSGNFLIAAAGLDKSAGTFTAPSGFTTLLSNSSSSVSIWIGYKVASGSETAITLTRSSGTVSGDTFWISEWSQSGTGSWTIFSSAHNYTDESTVNSWATGTTGTINVSNAHALAFVAIDTGNNATGSLSWSNSYSSITDWAFSTDNGQGDIAVGQLNPVTINTTTSSTHSYTGTADQNTGAIMVFGRIGYIVTTTASATSTVTGTRLDTGSVSSTITATASAQPLAIMANEAATSTVSGTRTDSRTVTSSITDIATVSARALANVNRLETATTHVTAIAQKHPVVLHVELFINGAWENVTQYVLYRTPISITRGRRDESAVADVSSMTIDFKNQDGRFTENNPSGAYYGQLSVNTAARLWILDDESRLVIPADVGNGKYGIYDLVSGVETFGSLQSNDVAYTNDMDLQFDGFTYAWGTSTLRIINKNDATGTNTGYVFSTYHGYLRLYWSTDGTTVLYAQSTYPLPKPWHGRKAVRVTLQTDVSGHYNIAFYYANSFADVTLNGWTQLGSTIIGASTTSVFASTAAVSVGYTWLGSVHGVNIYSGISGSGGTKIASVSFTTTADGTTTITDAYNNVWNVVGSAEIIRKQYRAHGQLASTRHRWDKTGRDVWAEITFSGLLRRINQGIALSSAYYRGMTLTPPVDVVAYWPCEDSADSTQLAAVVSGVSSAPPMTFIGTPTLASSSVFPCSSPLPVVNGASFTGVPPNYTGTGNLSVGFLSIATGTLTANAVTTRVWTSGTVSRVDVIYIDSTTVNITLYDQYGAQLQSTSIGPVPWTTGYYVQIDLSTTGNTTRWTMSWLAPGFTVAGTITNTVTGTVTQITSIQFGPNKDVTEYVFGHVTIFNQIPSVFNRLTLLSAWNGESAANRIARLCHEEGIQFVIYGSGSSSAMGPQGTETLLSLLRECEAVDDGILTESKDYIGLVYRSRDSMATFAGSMITADYSDADLFQIEPTDDDLLIKNDITISRKNGSSARKRAKKTNAIISRAPEDIGTYSDSKTINIFSDGSLLPYAAWRLSLGTVTEIRYPTITFNMVRTQTEIGTVLGDSIVNADVGDLLTIINPPAAFLVPDTIRQIVQGSTEKLTSTSWEITFNLAPASPFDIGQYDDDGVTRYDTENSVLAANITSTATSFTVSTLSGACWTTAVGSFPFDVSVGGERITVTSITSTSNPQTFTVTRSVNGVVTAHAYNTPVSLFRPSVYALDSGATTAVSTPSGSGTGTGGGSGGSGTGTTAANITFVNATNGSGCVGTEPTGAQSGDMLIAIMGLDSNTLVAPSGWIPLGTQIVNDTGDSNTGVWYIIRTTSAPSFNWTGRGDGGYAIGCFRGVASTPEQFAQDVFGTSVSPSVTVTHDKDMLVCLYADSSSSTIIAPTGMTLQGGPLFVTFATESFPTAGAISAQTWGSVTSPAAAFTIALNPGTSGGSGGGSGGGGGGGPVINITKLLIIIEENHTAEQALSGMSYLASLADQYVSLTNYTAISHPSLPNYLAIVGGDDFGITDDDGPGSHDLSGNSTIFGQAINAGKTAKSYLETMPSNAYTSDSGNYVVHHNPWVYFSDESAMYGTYDVPSGTTSSGALHNDVVGNSLPNISFIVPNLQNDAHDGSLAQADSWLSSWVPDILATTDYTNQNLLVVITFDEDDESSDNTVTTVLIHPSLAGKGNNSTAFNHYALTKLAADILGITPLSNGVDAASLKNVLNLPIGNTGGSGGSSGGGSSGGGTIGGGGSGGATGGGFIAGAGGNAIGNGNFNNWLASHDLGAASSWSDSDVPTQENAYFLDTEFASWTGIMCFAVGGIFSGDSWASAASGSYDSRWTTCLNTIKSKWGSRPAGNLHIRFAHEFNGDFSGWAVSNGNAANFVSAFQRFCNLQRSIIPGSISCWSPNYGTSSLSNIDDAYPGSAYVDVIGVDWYNDYGSPHQHAVTASDFNDNLNYSPGGNPQGLGAWLAYANRKGKPLSIPEFGNPAVDTGGGSGGGEAPDWAAAFIAWCKANGGSTGGKVWYANYFNVSNGYNAKFGIFNDGSDSNVEQPQTAAVFQANW